MVRGRVGSPSHGRTETRTYLLRDTQTHSSSTGLLLAAWSCPHFVLGGENIVAFNAEEEHLLQDRRTGGGGGGGELRGGETCEKPLLEKIQNKKQLLHMGKQISFGLLP